MSVPNPIQRLTTYDDMLLAWLRQQQGEAPPSDLRIIFGNEFTEVLAQPWHIANYIPSLAVGAVDQVVCEFSVPAQQLGICRQFGNALQNFTDFGNVRWKIRVNGQLVTGFDDIIAQIGNIIFPVECKIPLPRNSKIQVLATNIGAAPVLFVTARIDGTTFQTLPLAGVE